jgi:hypothetical protein
MIQWYFLANIWNGTQFFTADGKPLVGGKIATYSAGSMSQQAVTYADNAGNVENTNPLVLDSDGRIPQEIWLDVNYDYQFVLYQPDGETVIMACDNIGTHDPFPDQTNHEGSYLQTSGYDVKWSSPLPMTLGQDYKALTVSWGGSDTEWTSILPDVTGNSSRVLSTSGAAGSPYETLSWVDQGGSGAQEFVLALVSPYNLTADGNYNATWNATVYQESNDCTVADFGTEGDAVFTLTTAGIYKVTVTGRVRPVGYPEAMLSSDTMFYGVQVVGSDTEFNLSTHTEGGPASSWPANGFQNQLQWTDTFYVENYGGGATFTIGLYVNETAGVFQYNAACMVSVVRTSGSVWPNQPF